MSVFFTLRVLTCGALLAQLTGGISKGMAMLTLDQDYISRFRNQPMNFQQRLIYALQALGVGLYEGAVGQPLLYPSCIPSRPCCDGNMLARMPVLGAYKVSGPAL